ncbi:hypothetical protein STEG23_008140, partial [Scotinomys teguina]
DGFFKTVISEERENKLSFHLYSTTWTRTTADMIARMEECPRNFNPNKDLQ